MFLKPLFRLLLVLALACPLVHAQSVHWEPAGGSLVLNQTSELQLVFENCEPEGDFSLPNASGMTLERNGSQSDRTSVVNGSFSRTISLGFSVRATQSSRVSIPEFRVKTDKGTLSVAAASFEVGKSSLRGGTVSLDSVARSSILSPDEVWVGEVFPLNYELLVVRRYFAQAAPTFSWDPGVLVAEDWSRGNVEERLVGGERNVAYTLSSRGSFNAPGKMTLPTTSHLVNITTGSQPIGFFTTPSIEQFTINSGRHEVLVKPLPQPASRGFSGAVGQFQLTSKLVPASAQVGEPLTWTLTLEGTGNWQTINSLPSREVSADFRTVQPQPKRTTKPGKVFDATLSEDVILIPTVPGDYTLGPVTWSYFDPAKGDYVTVATPAHSVHVTPAVAAASTASPNPSAGPSGQSKAPPPPSVPAPLPAGQLSEGASAGSPFSPLNLGLLAVSFGLVPLAVWLGLALRKAYREDPFLPARRAREDQLRLLTKIEAASPKEIAGLLLRWRQTAAAVHGLKLAAPALKDLPAGSLYTDVWQETERALFAAEGTLPKDWVSRARQAATAITIPGFSPSSAFSARHLFLTVVMICMVLPPALKGSEGSAEQRYRSGDWKGAGELWRAATVQNPANWAAHHNLSLALSQQDQWPEAACHAAIAFVQNPREDLVRRQLKYSLGHANFTPMKIGALAGDSLPSTVTTWASPVQWQQVLWLSSLLFCLVLCLPLAAVYGILSRRLVLPSFLVCAGLAALAGLAMYSLNQYGQLADHRAVISWQSGTLYSVPTEADTEQKTSPLAPGTVAVADKEFLTWVHLSFSDGSSGWVRREAVVPFWKPEKR